MPGKRTKADTLSTHKTKRTHEVFKDEELRLVGQPIPVEEARKKWPKRYLCKDRVKKHTSQFPCSIDKSSECDVLQARRHFSQAMVDGCLFNLNDDAYIKADDGEPDYIAKIVELFETTNAELYFTARWFFRAEDTVIKVHANLIDKRQVFYSDAFDDNPLSSIVSKVNIAQVPDYAMKFVKGRSTKPFRRVWWDEIIQTVVTRAEPHNQAVLHPEQDRVLSVRENARLQGFPDCYQLFGPNKERCTQVGNAVAVPVAMALGYTVGLAWRRVGSSEDEPLTQLPMTFTECLAEIASENNSN